VKPADLDWQSLAATFSLAYRESGDIASALRDTFDAAAGHHSETADELADAVIASTARDHGITVRTLMFGPRQHAPARIDAWVRLKARGIPVRSIARRFHVASPWVLRAIRKAAERAQVANRKAAA
jgi:hypothetical protein